MTPLRALIAAAAMMWALASLPAGAAEQKRVALVIGNSAYVNAPTLANPKNDATDMAAALEKLGFVVVRGLDLDKAGFEKTLRAFAHELEDAGAGLLFYAGHGLQVGGQNYLVPIDAKLARERDLDFEAIRLDFVLKQMELDRDGKTNIVFLDACRDNPLARNLARTMGTRSASIGNGLAEVQTGVGTFISYSTQPGNVALDGGGRNSPFTTALTKHVGTAGQSLTSVMIDVRKEVLSATGGKQVPWDHSALTGDFYFNLAAVPNLARPGVPSNSRENNALKERMGKLEDELKRKSDAANTASAATLTNLKQRQRQMVDDNRRDQDRMFQIQRDSARETDQSKRMNGTQEIFRLQNAMSQRNRDIAELKAEIAKIEPPAAKAETAPEAK